MKKTIALFLALTLLLPLVFAFPASAEEPVTQEPFYMLNWGELNTKEFPHLARLIKLNVGNSGSNITLSYSGGGTITHSKLTDETLLKMATAMKKDMDARPDGMRYFTVFGPRKAYELLAENVIYLDRGADQLAVLMDALLAKYKEIGGKLDGFAIDVEYTALSAHSIYTNKAKNDPLVYNKIADDPRYATEVRPLLEERGFKFWDRIGEYTPEIYGISKDTGATYDQSRSIWDTVMRNRLNAYVTQWAYVPVQKYFPEASVSDYQSVDTYAWHKSVAVDDGGTTYAGGGNAFGAGNVSTYSFYYAHPNNDFYNSLSKYASYNDAYYAPTAFNTFLHNTNFAKRMYEATDTKMIAPWVTAYKYNQKKIGTLANTPYYTELLYHLALLDPEPFLGYVYESEYDFEDFILSCSILDDIFTELDKLAGYSDREPILIPQYWNSEFVLSGMYTNGRNLWRITPNSDAIDLESFKAEGADPTFRVAGQTVTFPGGKILEEPTIETAGSFGYWVETSKDVTPIITNDADRLDKYPALFLDFSNAEEGTFDYNACYPAGAWEFTWKKGGTTTIVKNGDNKLLAFNGTAVARSKTLPGNVTAGDNYAKDQAWSIIATIPEGLSAEATILLLQYAGTRQKATDGAFKIEGGKLYCGAVGTDEEGKPVQEYKELCAIAPGTYYFQRVLNFNNAENFLCDYYVYDSTGTLLTQAENVPVPLFSVMQTIGFSTTGADKDVLVDDFKIAVTGKVADFELYDATVGRLLTGQEMELARDKATAYRLSWLNATAKEETATVMAAIYNGSTLVEEKVIKEVKMAPGYDGVETGIVEVAEGQSVKVYLKTTIQQTEEPPVEEPKDEPKAEKDGLSIGLIAVIAAVVIAVVGLVVVLLVTKKPKATSTQA